MNDMTKIEAQLTQEVAAWRSPNARRKESEARNREERQQRVSTMPRVSRDPCYRCQVRGDIGCRHQRPSA